MAALLLLLIDIAGCARWLDEAGRSNRHAGSRRPVLARWRHDEATWLEYVDRVWRHDQRAVLTVIAWLVAATLIGALAALAVDSASVLRWAGLGLAAVVAGGVIGLGSARLGRARRLQGPRTISLSLVEVCNGVRCRPLHPRYPSSTRVELAGGDRLTMRFAVGDRPLAEVPVPPSGRRDAEAYIERFRAEFAADA